MRFSTPVTALVLALAASSVTGCHRDRAYSPADRIAMLQSPDPGQRRDAADDLMDGGGPSPQAVPYLIAAIQREQDPKTYGVMLLALGKSGAPEAKPYIEANLQNPNKNVRNRAEQALVYWSQRNPNGVPPPNMAPPPEMPVEPQEPGAPPQLPAPAARPAAPAAPPPQDQGQSI